MRRGWSLVPLKGKIPTLKDWTALPPTTEAEAIEYACAGNMGIRTGAISRLMVLDVDPKHGGFDALQALNLDLRGVPRVVTGSGGLHFYFKYPAGGLRSSAGKLGPGLDIRADGGQVVAPPSIHPDTGGTYAWELAPFGALPPCPDALLFQSAGNDTPARLPDVIAPGARNSTLMSLAGAARRRGANRAEILALITAANARCEEPLLARELEAIAESATRYEPAAPTDHLTDTGNAARFVRQHRATVRSVPGWGWVIDRPPWERDATKTAIELAKDTARSILLEAANAEDPDRRKALALHALRSESAERLAAMVKLAASDPALVEHADAFDRDPMLFGVANGVVDLRTGILRPYAPEDLITKHSPVRFDPDAPCPRFEAFLAAIIPDDALRLFVQRSVGYSLTGSTREQLFFLLWGLGSNGKSTFLEIIRAMLGSYGVAASTNVFITKRAGGVPNDLAMLAGTRFVSAIEMAEEQRLDEALVKAVTGGDVISARFLFKEYFQFMPAFKLWLATNHKPRIKGTDHAIWRRVRLLPFTVQIPDKEQDKKLGETLRAELPGILNWAVKGCLDWQQGGLEPPGAVVEATQAYREEQDTLAGWLEEKCERRGGATTPFRELYASYAAWVESVGETPASARSFGQELSARGFTPAEKKATGGISLRENIALIPPAAGDRLEEF